MSDEITNMPNYITKKLDFYCPVSPYLLWHHGLSFKECPLNPSNRDMGYCTDCHLRGKNQVKIKTHKKNKNSRKQLPKTEKRNRELVPKIGKTYVSK